MSAVISGPIQFTYNDYLLLPEERRYEIIDGELFMVPAPLTHHLKITRNLFKPIDNYVESNQIGETLFAPVDIIFTKTDIVQPDILFILNENMTILTDENVQGAPDLVVEILSPSSIKRDRELKMKLYSFFGVKEYWIADPDECTVEVYALKNQVLTLHKQYQKAESMRSVLLHDLKIPLSSVFESKTL